LLSKYQDETIVNWLDGKAYNIVWDFGTWNKGHWYGNVPTEQGTIEFNKNSDTVVFKLSGELKYKYSHRYELHNYVTFLVEDADFKESYDGIHGTIISIADITSEKIITVKTTVVAKKTGIVKGFATVSVWNLGNWKDGTWYGGIKNDASYYLHTRDRVAGKDVVSGYKNYAITSYASGVDNTSFAVKIAKRLEDSSITYYISNYLFNYNISDDYVSISTAVLNGTTGDNVNYLPTPNSNFGNDVADMLYVKDVYAPILTVLII
jgi:hypothetical protein